MQLRLFLNLSDVYRRVNAQSVEQHPNVVVIFATTVRVKFRNFLLRTKSTIRISQMVELRAFLLDRTQTALFIATRAIVFGTMEIVTKVVWQQPISNKDEQ
jgi:hypothetical protein